MGEGGCQAVVLWHREWFWKYESSNVKNVPQKKKITVEHILSQNLDFEKEGIKLADLGFETQKQLEDYLHRIGNLTLLYNTDNSAIGNWDFADKTDVYKKSDFKITHDSRSTGNTY